MYMKIKTIFLLLTLQQIMLCKADEIGAEWYDFVVDLTYRVGRHHTPTEELKHAIVNTNGFIHIKNINGAIRDTHTSTVHIATSTKEAQDLAKIIKERDEAEVLVSDGNNTLVLNSEEKVYHLIFDPEG